MYLLPHWQPHCAVNNDDLVQQYVRPVAHTARPWRHEGWTRQTSQTRRDERDTPSTDQARCKKSTTCCCVDVSPRPCTRQANTPYDRWCGIVQVVAALVLVVMLATRIVSVPACVAVENRLSLRSCAIDSNAHRRWAVGGHANARSPAVAAVLSSTESARPSRRTTMCAYARHPTHEYGAATACTPRRARVPGADGRVTAT